MKSYIFRDFHLCAANRSLKKGDRTISLTSKAFDVLLYLVERSGQLVTKDEILGAVWDGRFVEEANLAVQVGRLRRSLDESKQERIIETASGIGYRFLAPVSVEPEQRSNRSLVEPNLRAEARRHIGKGRLFKKKAHAGRSNRSNSFVSGRDCRKSILGRGLRRSRSLPLPFVHL